MTCPPSLSGWAGRIIDGLGDTTVSTGSVVSWLQYNLPKLNLSIGTDFTLTSSGCIDPDMSMNISGIYEEIYYCDYLRKRAGQLLGGTSFQDIVEFKGEEQGSVRWVSSKDRSKEARGLAQDCKTSLNELINWYDELGASGNYAYQILYNLRDDPAGYGLKDFTPPGSYYHDYNTVWTNMTPY